MNINVIVNLEDIRSCIAHYLLKINVIINKKRARARVDTLPASGNPWLSSTPLP